MADNIKGISGHSGASTAIASYQSYSAPEVSKAADVKTTEAKGVAESKQTAVPGDTTEISDEAKVGETDEKNPVNLEAMTAADEAKEADHAE